MAHLNIIDRDGDTIEVLYYCSNFCARQSEHYNGWYGCHELHAPEYCATCETPLNYIQHEYN